MQICHIQTSMSRDPSLSSFSLLGAVFPFLPAQQQYKQIKSSNRSNSKSKIPPIVTPTLSPMTNKLVRPIQYSSIISCWSNSIILTPAIEWFSTPLAIGLTNSYWLAYWSQVIIITAVRHGTVEYGFIEIPDNTTKAKRRQLRNATVNN